MNTLRILVGSFMILMVASTMICGMWIRKNQITDPGSLKFHMISGVISAILMILYFMMTFKKS